MKILHAIGRWLYRTFEPHRFLELPEDLDLIDPVPPPGAPAMTDTERMLEAYERESVRLLCAAGRPHG